MLKQEWGLIAKEHQATESEWKHCLVNIDYCIDILNEVKSTVLDRSQQASFSIFNELLTQVHSMFKHEATSMSLEATLRNISLLNDKYHLIDKE